MHSDFWANRIVKAARNADCSGEVCGPRQKGESVFLWMDFGLLASDCYGGPVRTVLGKPVGFSCCAAAVRESSEHLGGWERNCSFIPILVLNFANHLMQGPDVKQAFCYSSMAWSRIWEGGCKIGSHGQKFK